MEQNSAHKTTVMGVLIMIKILLVYATIGIIPPVLYMIEYYRGHYAGGDYIFMNALHYLFPASIIFMVIPYPSGWQFFILTVISFAANALLYSLAFYIALNIVKIAIIALKFIGKI